MISYLPANKRVDCVPGMTWIVSYSLPSLSNLASTLAASDSITNCPLFVSIVIRIPANARMGRKAKAIQVPMRRRLPRRRHSFAVEQTKRELLRCHSFSLTRPSIAKERQPAERVLRGRLLRSMAPTPRQHERRWQVEPMDRVEASDRPIRQALRKIRTQHTQARRITRRQ